MSAPDHLYSNDIDFSVLALQDPEFNKHVKFNGQLDFSNPEAVQQLTKSLLKRDFRLNIELPCDRLCPPVPNRFNYILWIQGLLDTTADTYTECFDPNREVVGLDIGTGASCIYALLGCSQRPAWKFAVTDIDDKNMQYARRNIIHNNLKSRIRPLQTTTKSPLIPLDALGIESIDFTICNPPFYASVSELLASAASKSRPPYSACTGAEIEMVTPGGEVAFVTCIIEESVRLRERCQWYTSMLGKLSSVPVLVEKLKGAGVGNWGVKEFVQGGKTRRWGIAWSWGKLRPRMDVARAIPGLPKYLLPFPSETIFSISNISIDDTASRVNTLLQNLDLQWQYHSPLATGIGFARQNVWSRAARRQKNQTSSRTGRSATNDDDNKMDEHDDEEDAALGFKIHLTQSHEKGAIQIWTRWMSGEESVLFESFCGMLKRELSSL
ncbi:hypothetical protein MMC12_000433 [Toensbergia leucococca]|nr:hypothetical protein [Toensbergia leucococca]